MFTTRCYASMAYTVIICLSICLSVCLVCLYVRLLQLTSQCSTKMVEDRIMQTIRSEFSFLMQMIWRKFEWGRSFHVENAGGVC